MSNIRRIAASLLFSAWTIGADSAIAQTDTLTVMTYNVLNYGDHCQADNSTLHGYLRMIAAYTKPDIPSLVKMAAIQTGPSDFHGTSPLGFGDSILNEALNAALAGRYSYAPLTNNTGSGDMSVLFYNQQKLGFLSVKTLVSNITDFNLYKLYCKDPALAATRDTTYLYVVLNHTQSGNASDTRDAQITAEASALQARFSYLPNMIDMGDFNARSSYEMCYQQLANATDTSFRFYDPPFSLDNDLSYPAN